MIKAQWAKARLDFRFEAITSRERMWHKDTFFVRVWHSDTPEIGRASGRERVCQSV